MASSYPQLRELSVDGFALSESARFTVIAPRRPECRQCQGAVPPTRRGRQRSPAVASSVLNDVRSAAPPEPMLRRICSVPMCWSGPFVREKRKPCAGSFENCGGLSHYTVNGGPQAGPRGGTGPTRGRGNADGREFGKGMPAGAVPCSALGSAPGPSGGASGLLSEPGTPIERGANAPAYLTPLGAGASAHSETVPAPRGFQGRFPASRPRGVPLPLFTLPR
jgi:hypothetical protein